MELKIVEKKEEPLFKRVSYVLEAEVGKAPTPSRTELRALAANFLKLEDNKFVIGSVKSYFGDSKLYIPVRVYDSEETLKRIELPSVIKRNKLFEKKEESKEGEAS